MKISLSTIRTVNMLYGSAGDPASDGIQALVKKIGSQLGAVDEVDDFSNKFNGVIIVKVVVCKKHPDADKLSICMIDDGGLAQNMERNDSGLIQIVCGADNVKDGMLAAWLPPGSTVPSTVKSDPFILGSREIRGVVSHGMLASPKELGIGNDHSGILQVDVDVSPGTTFIAAYNLENDKVIDIENKMFTHRPDCFGFLGVAREIEGIHHRAYQSPDWYITDPEIPAVETDKLPMEVINDIPELVPRFAAIALSGVTIKQSPVWLRIFLSSVGIKPVNNIVDFTNYFMLETGQPIHAYDYDKVKNLSNDDTARLTIRNPNSGEAIKILSGKEIEPRREAMMVAADKELVCVGGAIGGLNSEVDENTKNIIIEAASWDMYNIRSTAMMHGIFTDAVTRFTKGQSPLQNKAVLAKIVDEIRKNAGGKVAGELIDIINMPPEVLERNAIHPPVRVESGFINARLGLKLSALDMAGLLENVEFQVKVNGDELEVKAPFWRTDIEIREDVVEEIGRLNGYDNLPLELPRRVIAPPPRNSTLDLKNKIRNTLASAGANEVLTYSFIHDGLIDKAGQDKNKAYQLSNALSPDLQYYRLSLTPSLLEKVGKNIKAGYDEFALFEIGKAHIKGFENDEGLPREFERVSLVYSSKDKHEKSEYGAAYYQARVQLINLLKRLNITEKVSFESIETDEADQATTYYEPNRAATIIIQDKTLGRIGEYDARVRKALKLPEYTAGFELGLSVLGEYAKDQPAYVPLSKFPEVEQDITLKVPANVSYGQVYECIKNVIDELKASESVIELFPLDIYQKDINPEFRQITLRLKITSYVKTFTSEEINTLLDSAADSAHKEFGAQRI